MKHTPIWFFLVLICSLFAAQVIHAASGTSATLSPTLARTLDFRSLPSDAYSHLRKKWSGDLFILIDDAPSPLLYMFDRSGRIKFDAAIQISGASSVRVHDFAAAPDGSVWACGKAESTTGQRSFFLAHITNDGQPVQIIRTNPYYPQYLTLGPDGTVWTMGYSQDDNGIDQTQNSLRHFDGSGKLIASGMPTNSVGLMRTMLGFLGFYQGRLGWYSPSSGSGADHTVPRGGYLEISPNDLAVLNSYPAAPRNWNDRILGFALTPSGRLFIEMFHPSLGGTRKPPDLYELNRGGKEWVQTDGPVNKQGHLSYLEGNDGESLVFSGVLTDKSEFNLSLLEVSHKASQ